ncbi:thermonuclease family protein [Viridibacillus sp. YIM B01967]|uniref:Thermonuclease family protein n=1 Tax=Viridibacillus soli TaxID=2798301 RepID=A0ABS1H6J0_9BACL|nr:thermonuclease family protein [Viridibacillus soli]MBK3494924.1 thermonuclease family protein [Viridibacillus soli]
MKKWGLFVIGCLVFLLQACTEAEETKTDESNNRIQVEVVSIMDGDTIKVKYDGATKNVRYLLVDAPEMYHKQLGEQPIGREAQARNREILNNAKKVSIEFDVGDQEDKYGRLLAYIYADGESVQEQLIREGLVRVGYIYEPNTTNVEAYEAIQEEAKAARKGIWQYDGYVTNRGFDKSAVKGLTPNETLSKSTNKANSGDQSNKADCSIKGNINNKGNKIYHMPGSNNYDAVKEEKMFCTEKEAEQAGFRKAS